LQDCTDERPEILETLEILPPCDPAILQSCGPAILPCVL
jgi:hypothetical protein